MEMSFKELRAINVSDKIEKKNGLNYLSWACAVDELLQRDPQANWEYGTPTLFGESMMVTCTVRAFGKAMTAQLPVMDHRNKCIPNPDAFSVNSSMQRCLVKAIALHGIGLYIYAKEDFPVEQVSTLTDAQVENLERLISEVSANKAAFLKYMKADSLASIQSSSYDTCVAALEGKRRK